MVHLNNGKKKTGTVLHSMTTWWVFKKLDPYNGLLGDNPFLVSWKNLNKQHNQVESTVPKP